MPKSLILLQILNPQLKDFKIQQSEELQHPTCDILVETRGRRQKRIKHHPFPCSFRTTSERLYSSEQKDRQYTSLFFPNQFSIGLTQHILKPLKTNFSSFIFIYIFPLPHKCCFKSFETSLQFVLRDSDLVRIMPKIMQYFIQDP